MALSAPMGTPYMTHQSGLNLKFLPKKGNAASHLLQRCLTRKIVNHFETDPMGNYKAILKAKDVCNDIVSVFLGDDRSIISSSLGQAFNMSIMHKLHVNRLYDQIEVMTTSPAPVSSKTTRPDIATIYHLERDYVHTDRSARVNIPAATVDAVERLRSKYATFDVVGGTEREAVKNHETMEKQADQEARSYIKELEETIKPPMFALKSSHEKGVIDQAIVTLLETCIPFSLARVYERFATSAAEGSTPGDWENNLLLQQTLAREYARDTCRVAFCLGRSPTTFLPKLIDTGLKAVQNITHNESQALIYDVNNHAFFKLKGTIHLSMQAYNFITTHPAVSKTLRPCRLVDVKSVYYKPRGAFLEDPSQSTAKMYPTEEHETDSSALEELVRTVKDGTFPKQGKQGEGFLKLAEAGKELMAGRNVEEGQARTSNRDRYKLCTYDVNAENLYVLHGNEAYIIDYTREYCRKTDIPDYYGRTPSLVSVKHNLFRITLGDIDESHEQMNKWISTVVTASDRGPACGGTEPRNFFSVKPVHMYTPGLSPQRLTFGLNELKTAFMDPALYDTTDLQTALNDNLKVYASIDSPDLAYMKTLFVEKLSTAHMRDDLLKTYFKNRTATGDDYEQGQTVLRKLRMIELHPFFNVCTDVNNVNGKKTFRLEPRNTYMAIPPYVMSAHVMKLRGQFMLACGATEKEINNLNTELTNAATLLKQQRYDKDDCDVPEEVTEISKKLANMFKAAFVRSGHDAKHINVLFADFLHDEGCWAMCKYVVIPILAKGHVMYMNDIGTSFRQKSVVKDRLLINESTSSCSAFQGDRLFASDVVMSGNTGIVLNECWPPVLKAAALVMQFCMLTPRAISASIMAGCHPGFAVDYIRHDKMYSEQAVFTLVGSHEMIVTNGEVREIDTGDGAIDIDAKTSTMTTRNTLGAGAVLVPTAYPNETAIPQAQYVTGKPIISRDGITRSRYYSLQNALHQNKTLEKADKDVILQQLGTPTRNTKRKKTEDIHEFVPMLRPVNEPEREHSTHIRHRKNCMYSSHGIKEFSMGEIL